MDNLGYGEVGVYGGGITRGAPTPRIDQLASEGTRLTNFNVEAQCTPSRSAILTGRFSDPLRHPLGADRRRARRPHAVGSDDRRDAVGAGYATALFGKWHLGSMRAACRTIRASTSGTASRARRTRRSGPRRPRSALGVQFAHIMEGRKGEKSRELVVYDLDQRR